MWEKEDVQHQIIDVLVSLKLYKKKVKHDQNPKRHLKRKPKMETRKKRGEEKGKMQLRKKVKIMKRLLLQRKESSKQRTRK